MSRAPDGPDPVDADPPDADPLDDEGPAAPPRANGELVFAEPWQSRLFGTTMQLRESGRLDWERFRHGLITQIDRHQRRLADGGEPEVTAYDYWGCWQRALEELLAATGVVSAADLAARSAELAARPADHDHDHVH